MRKLKVDKSKIAGKGLFTTDAFEQGEMIGLAHENDQPSTFIGKYHNHSDKPNAVNVKLGDKRYLMAKRPLKKGEEITTNYRLQPELEQPEEFAKGGLVKMPKPSKQGLASKKFSRSLEATNRLFTENYLFSKPKSKKRKVFDPNAKYEDGGFLPIAEYGMPMGTGMSQNYQGRRKFIHQDGGVISQEDIDAANNAMMKARLAYANMHGNPAAQRMVVAPDQPYDFGNGMTGTHYMASMDNYAVPQIQDENGQLMLGDYGPESAEAIRFDTDEDANYFAENYKEITPDASYRQEGFAVGGIASPLDLDPETMKKYTATLKSLENNIKKGYRSGKWYPHPSVEGGADTIAYGHKLLPGESNLYQGITEEQASALQQKDILAKQVEAKRIVDKQYGPGTYDGLPQDAQMLLVDYQYNVSGGLNKFPSFVDGVVTGDKTKMNEEYERGSKVGKLTTRNNWTKEVIDTLDYTKPKVVIEPNIPLANIADATSVILPQVEGPKLQEGGNVVSQQGWDYTKEGDKYLTRKTGTQDWIEAQGKPLQAIKQSIYQEAPTVTPVAPVTTQPITGDPKVLDIQTKLKEAGYDLGRYGPNKDGIDGVMGNTTKLAYDAYKANIPPNQVKTPKPTTKTSINYTVNRDLPNGYLPVIQPGQEACVEGKGCSFNVSTKMENLLGNIADGPVWANDAWFNKSDVLNKGGDLVYDSNSKIYNQMGKVPKEVYSKLQVGDYVQLNRIDTKSSAEFAAETKDGLQNEQIEHLGFIVGKDKDGTPLIWHGSETGKAFIKRIDEPITLDDHDKNIFTYKVSSIVRSPNLKDVDFSGLQNSPYYTPVDPDKKLVPKKGATESQVEAAKSFNNSVGQFKNLGYSQDDANYVGQILIGGIMTRESTGNEDWKLGPKQTAAYLIKDVAGINAMDIPGSQYFTKDGKPIRTPGKEFEGDQGSVGIYQIKPDYNFRTKDGGLNPLGKKLQKLGVKVEDITSDNIQAQTIAGTLILLDNYKQLKDNPDFDIKTNMYKGKIPASYILAKSWNAGSGWESREKYQKFLDDLDITYSNKALNEAVDFIEVTGGKSINSELSTIEEQQRQALEKKKQENAKKYTQQKQQELAVRADTVRKFPTIAESTAVNTNYTQKGPKSFDLAEYTQQGPTKTVYTYSGRPGAMYKKDAKGNWYINLGNQTGNQFVKIDDKDGSRSAILNKGAIPSTPKKYQTGGIHMLLSDSEIEEFRRGGYIIEDLD